VLRVAGLRHPASLRTGRDVRTRGTDPRMITDVFCRFHICSNIDETLRGQIQDLWRGFPEGMGMEVPQWRWGIHEQSPGMRLGGWSPAEADYVLQITIQWCNWLKEGKTVFFKLSIIDEFLYSDGKRQDACANTTNTWIRHCVWRHLAVLTEIQQ